jgi:hypothetical protein
MTQLLASAGENVVDVALAKVSIVTSKIPAGGGRLNTSKPGPVESAASETWEKIRILVKEASRKGWEAAKPLIDDVLAFIDARAEELRSSADQFRKLIIEKIHELIRETTNLILISVRNSVQIGNQSYLLNSIELQTKLVFSGSVEGSITALCKFVGSGELVVTGKYTLASGEAGPTS